MSVILDFPCRNKDESTEDYLTRVMAYAVFLEQKFLNKTYVIIDSKYEQMIKETLCGDKNDINV